MLHWGIHLQQDKLQIKSLGKGYTDYIANQLNKVELLASFDKRFAVPGYTTTDVLHDLQTNVSKPDPTEIQLTFKVRSKMQKSLRLMLVRMICCNK